MGKTSDVLAMLDRIADAARASQRREELRASERALSHLVEPSLYWKGYADSMSAIADLMRAANESAQTPYIDPERDARCVRAGMLDLLTSIPPLGDSDDDETRGARHARIAARRILERSS